MKVYNFEKKHFEGTWMVDIDGYHINQIKNFLKYDNMPTESIQKIVLNAGKILNYCPNPNSQIKSKKTGLVIGKVQSGKTSNFIATTALAFDNGYKIVVVLGGTKKNLVEQNKKRIESYFDKDESVIVYDTENNMNLLNCDTIKRFINANKKIIIVSLKSTTKINKLSKQLFSDEYFYKLPLMIIDDEGDEFTLNTAVNKRQMSSTYNAVVNLLDKLFICVFISVTATPQGNLIISTIDVLSPDFGVLVHPGEGYCGLETFHSIDSPHCIEIPENEMSLLDDEGIPTSYLDALATYFIAASIFLLQGNQNKKFSMLVHPSRVVNDLTCVYEKTNKTLEKWRNCVDNCDDVSFEGLKEKLKSAYDYFKSEGIDTGDFDCVLKTACEIIVLTGLHLITGNNQLNDNDKHFVNNIYIGGQMVGRGLTIKGLAITYIIRSAKGISNVDTVQQRARWFGYKYNMIDLCRIYATKKIISNFNDIRVHDEELWEMIETNNLNGTKFKEMKRLFRLNDELRLTRPSVGKTMKMCFKNWNKENKFQMDSIKRQRNIELIENMYRSYASVIEKKSIGIKSSHEVVRNLSYNDVMNNFFCSYISPDNSDCSITFLEKLRKVFNKDFKEDIKCDLIWMRYGKYSTHDISDDGIIPNYMVGRRPHGVKLEDCDYKGDLEFRRDNVITIQIHNIQNKKDPKQYGPVLAIFIPNTILSKLLDYVVPEN